VGHDRERSQRIARHRRRPQLMLVDLESFYIVATTLHEIWKDNLFQYPSDARITGIGKLDSRHD
jgi:hypothetical protein